MNIPETILKQITDSSEKRYPIDDSYTVLGGLAQEKHRQCYNIGATFGYSLAATQLEEKDNEIKRLTKIVVEKDTDNDNLANMITDCDEEIARLNNLINNPELNNFVESVKLEAAHQLERWGIDKEEKEPPHHYILVSAKLLGKLSVAIWDKDIDKFKHHCITLAAELHNCHRQIQKEGTVINKYFNNLL